MKTAEEKFIEKWFGLPVPDDWDKNYEPLANFSISQLEKMLEQYAKEQQRITLDLFREFLLKEGWADTDIVQEWTESDYKDFETWKTSQTQK